MKKKLFYFICALLSSGALFISCNEGDETPSIPKPISIPYIAIQYAQSTYGYGKGKTNIINDIPNVVAIAVDTVVGFEGGYGGKTGRDSIQVKKSDITGWPDTIEVGGYKLSFEKFNNSSFKTVVTSFVVIAEPISNPGPTALEGNYLRTATGVTIEIKRIFDGVYVIDNPGAAGVTPFPYLLFNYKDASGIDSLSFPIQPNPCGGGLQLVDPTAPPSLKSSEYTASYNPNISSLSPITLQWRIYEFPTSLPTASHPGAALCQWGLGVRTLIKQ